MCVYGLKAYPMLPKTFYHKDSTFSLLLEAGNQHKPHSTTEQRNGNGCDQHGTMTTAQTLNNRKAWLQLKMNNVFQILLLKTLALSKIGIVR